MIVKISNLSEGEHTFDFTEPVENLELQDQFVGNIKTRVDLNKLHDQIITHVHSNLVARFECDRCAKEFDTELESDYKMVYLMNEKPEDSDSLYVSYLPREADKIDFKSDVREFAILSIPMKKLCKEDCKGLCPRCGADLNESSCTCGNDNIDERWKPLLNKKDNSNFN